MSTLIPLARGHLLVDAGEEETAAAYQRSSCTGFLREPGDAESRSARRVGGKIRTASLATAICRSEGWPPILSGSGSGTRALIALVSHIAPRAISTFAILIPLGRRSAGGSAAGALAA